jgi:hypothetical protein
MGFLDSSAVFYAPSSFQRPSPYERRHHQRLERLISRVFMGPEYYFSVAGTSRQPPRAFEDFTYGANRMAAPPHDPNR